MTIIDNIDLGDELQAEEARLKRTTHCTHTHAHTHTHLTGCGNAFGDAGQVGHEQDIVGLLWGGGGGILAAMQSARQEHAGTNTVEFTLEGSLVQYWQLGAQARHLAQYVMILWQFACRQHTQVYAQQEQPQCMGGGGGGGIPACTALK